MQFTVAGLLPDLMEISENDKEDTLDNSTDKENTEAGKKNFATKDPKNKHRGIKNPRSTREISHPEVQSLSGHTVFGNLTSKKEVSNACGVQRCSNN